MNFSKLLTDWYLQHKRKLPWRNTYDPYFVWLSEIILQQTRVAQGLPYFLAFAKAFPTVADLASADEQQVLKLWQGLGYYSRARNLQRAAKIVVQQYGGVFPDNFPELQKLPGVGQYTAAAIASFCFGERVPVVDGNVFRVLSRVFDIESDIASSSAKKEFFELAASLMPADAATFNQAIMEFGALQCVPKNPDCAVCPMNAGCLALQKKKVALLPVKSKKAPVKQRFFHYIVASDDHGQTLLEKRTGKGIWNSLYQFPLVETEKPSSISELLPLRHFENVTSAVEIERGIIHKLTHQHLHISFSSVKIEGAIAGGIKISDLRTFPVPAVISDFIERHF